MKFDARPDRSLIRMTGGSRRYVMVTFTAPLVPAKDGRIPGNVAFVLDRSGSMAGERKIELVCDAADKAIGMLHPDDRFALVVYDNEIDILMESTPASNEAKRAALLKLERVSPRGTTNLSGGWLSGCELAASGLDAAIPAKCLLLTDGLANMGITEPAELTRRAGELRRQGILTSTFGVGSDFDERLLQKMADEGGGHSFYIEKPEQISDFLTTELGDTLEVVAQDAVLRFLLPAGADARLLNRFRSSHRDGSFEVDLGAIVSGQDVTVVIELRLPAGTVGDTISASVCLSDRDAVLNAPPAMLNWTFADHDANDRQERDRVVVAAAAELFAAKARDEALEHNRRQDFDAARAVMRDTANRIRGFAGDDKRLHELAVTLSDESQEYRRIMPVMEMKARYFQSQHALRDRDGEGKSRRRRT
jgi:Ca-activated chloride channel homolog